MNFEDESIIEASGFRIPPEYELFKRLFDIIVSLILLIIASPFMLLTAILVKVTSPGPVIYKQIRITKNQKEFSIYKFRSMTATAEPNQDLFWLRATMLVSLQWVNLSEQFVLMNYHKSLMY